MNRPQPKVSPLAGRSPVDPPMPERAPVTRLSPPTSGGDVKVTTTLPPDLAERARSALVYTQTTEGVRTLKSLIVQAIEAEVGRLEAQYNNGKPFPMVGALPHGPRPGAGRL